MLIRETEKPAAHRQKGQGMNTGWREGPNQAVSRPCEEMLRTPVFWVINTFVSTFSLTLTLHLPLLFLFVSGIACHCNRSFHQDTCCIFCLFLLFFCCIFFSGFSPSTLIVANITLVYSTSVTLAPVLNSPSISNCQLEIFT